MLIISKKYSLFAFAHLKPYNLFLSYMVRSNIILRNVQAVKVNTMLERYFFHYSHTCKPVIVSKCSFIFMAFVLPGLARAIYQVFTCPQDIVFAVFLEFPRSLAQPYLSTPSRHLAPLLRRPYWNVLGQVVIRLLAVVQFGRF